MKVREGMVNGHRLLLNFFVIFFLVTVNTAAAQQQQQQPQQAQTSQGLPIVFIPAITGNILAVVSLLIGTSSFVLGLRIQSATRATPAESELYQQQQSRSTTLPSSIVHKYFDLLILALVIPSIGLNTYGILLVGSHLYIEETPYLSLLFVLFIPAGAILFLVRKLRTH
jgi:hypothetical protein